MVVEKVLACADAASRADGGPDGGPAQVRRLPRGSHLEAGRTLRMFLRGSEQASSPGRRRLPGRSISSGLVFG